MRWPWFGSPDAGGSGYARHTTTLTNAAPDDSVLEARTPDLNPWKGVAVLALHSHTADEPCDDRCSVYPAAP